MGVNCRRFLQVNVAPEASLHTSPEQVSEICAGAGELLRMCDYRVNKRSEFDVTTEFDGTSDDIVKTAGKLITSVVQYYFARQQKKKQKKHFTNFKPCELCKVLRGIKLLKRTAFLNEHGDANVVASKFVDEIVTVGKELQFELWKPNELIALSWLLVDIDVQRCREVSTNFPCFEFFLFHYRV